MILSAFKKYFYWFLLSLVLILGFALRLKMLIDNPSFWFDESALGYNVLTLKFTELFGILHLQQVTPPLFLAASKIIVNIFGASDLKIRLISFIAGNLSILMFYLVLRQNLKSKTAILVAMIAFCCNLQLLKFSVEFKPYILEVFSMCLILYVFNKFSYENSYKKILLYGILFAVMPWFAFVSIVLLTIAYIIIFSKQNYKKWLVLVAPSVFSFITFIFYYINISSAYRPFLSAFFDKMYLTIPTVLTSISQTFIFFFELKLFLIPLILFVLGYILCFFRKENKFFLIFSNVVFVIFILMSFSKFYMMYERFMLFLMPVMIIFAVIPLEYLSNKRKIYSVIISFLTLLVFIIPSIRISELMFTHKYEKKSDARELMQFMVERLNPNEEIIVDRLSICDFLYYSKYYDLKNPVIIDSKIKNDRILYNVNNEILFLKSNSWLYSSWEKPDLSGVNCKYKKEGNAGSVVAFIVGKNL